MLSDSSLVRVVMIDKYGNHYLVFETYPLIATDMSLDFEQFCDETCYLNGVYPDSYRIDIINAFLNLKTIVQDTNFIANAALLQANMKRYHDSVKIATMNQRINQYHMYWRAGRTSLTDLSFSDKEKFFGNRHNLGQ